MIEPESSRFTAFKAPGVAWTMFNTSVLKNRKGGHEETSWISWSTTWLSGDGEREALCLKGSASLTGSFWLKFYISLSTICFWKYSPWDIGEGRGSEVLHSPVAESPNSTWSHFSSCKRRWDSHHGRSFFLAWYPPAPLVLKVPEDAVSLVALPGQPVGTHLEYFQLGGFQWQVLRSVGLCLSPCHSNSVSPLYSLFFSSHSLFSLLSTPPPPLSISLFFYLSSPLFTSLSFFPLLHFFPLSHDLPTRQITCYWTVHPSFNTQRPCTYGFIGESCRFVTKLTSVSLRTTVKENVSYFLLSNMMSMYNV